MATDRRRTVPGLLRGLDGRVALVLVTAAFALLFLEYVAIQPIFGVGRGGRPPLTVERLSTWSLYSFLAYMAVPAALTVLVLRERLRDFGLTFHGFLRHLPLYCLLYVLMVPVVYLAAKRPDFLRTYPFAADARSSLSTFLRWELYYGLQFLALEFFFRGFLLFGLERRFGLNAIFVMVVPYCMLHFHKPMLEATAAIGAGLVLGLLALRTRCILGGVLIHWSVAVTMDLMAIKGQGGFL